MGGPLAVVRLVVGFPMRLVKGLLGQGGGGGDVDSARWLIVGLGNPGKRFVHTRHNIGFDIVDVFAAQEGLSFSAGGNKELQKLQKKSNAHLAVGVIANTPVVLAKPQTYMNLSGESIEKLMKHWRTPKTNMLIIYDDLDTPVTVLKLKCKGGHGGHNGVRNIIDECPGCGDKVFPRLKIGVGRPKTGVEVYDHVLTRFDPTDRVKLESETFPSACDAIRGVLTQGLDKTMTAVNNPGGVSDKSKKPKQPKQPQQKKKQKDEKLDPAVSTLVENAVANIISSQSNSSDVKATDG